MCDRAVEKDLKMLKFVPDYFKTQEMCEKPVKRSLFAIINVPDQHKTQEISKNVISENSAMLQFIPNS